MNFNDFIHFKSDSPILEFVYTDIVNGEIETENLKKYHISLPKLEKKYYNGDKLNKLEKALLILKLDKIKDLEEISKGDEDLMEAVERIKDATFDINTIGLYDAELDRKWKEEAKIAYYNKIAKEDGREEGQFSIISTMLKNGITPKKVIEMTGISLEKIKKMGLL